MLECKDTLGSSMELSKNIDKNSNILYNKYNVYIGVLQMKITFYEKKNGVKPVKEFLDSLDEDMRAKMSVKISFLKQYGKQLRLPHSRYIQDGIFELRVQCGNDITRVLYFFIRGDEAILTNGFIKKSQKTPRSEIDLAIKYKKDYEHRHNGGI